MFQNPLNKWSRTHEYSLKQLDWHRKIQLKRMATIALFSLKEEC